MPETGFFAQKQRSPASLGLVILLHGALIAAVVLVKGPAFQHIIDRTTVTLIPLTPDPPPDRPPPPPRPEQPQRPMEHVDQLPPLYDTPPLGPPFDPGPPQTAHTETAGTALDIPRLPPEPVHVPVRRAAQLDMSSGLQPPYPPSEERAQRDGRVQVRITIGLDGRVTDIALVSATSDAFWRATQQQALRHWRFRPATVDGRPVEETRVMSVAFRIQDQG
ncbi:MAG: energy transducer TonB [Sphingomonadaceae bacterium]|nr:energy transducer TonB [Sphingomonadaceae bacterium]